MKYTLIASAPLAAVLVWVVALMIDPGIYTPLSVLMIGLGLITMTTIGTVGLVLVGARWAYRLLVAMVGVTLVVALSRPIDGIAIAGLVLSGAALVALFIPAASRLRRKLPAASGPPARAVVATLLALSTPLVLGLIPYEPNGWVVLFAFSAPLFAFLYSRTISGGLALMRFGVLLMALVSAPLMPLPHAVASLAMGGAIAIISWNKDVAVAFGPLLEKGTTYAIPPELAPSEILDGAGIDKRGKRK